MTDVWRLSAAELAAAYRRRETDPVAVFDALAARIEAINPAINAIVERDRQARAAAERSAERFARGAPLGPLDGVPVTIKDNILVAGLPCRWGSRLYAEYVPTQDELPVARLRTGGAVIVGKTNVPEFTLEGYTTNLLFGTTRNPWDTRLTPGGSSGGAVAAVAAGLGPLALGTDGGGSIRRPVSHTGLVGLKTTIGRVARGPSLPQILLDLETIGPIARTVEDAALAMQVIGGADVFDRRSLGAADARKRARPLRLRYVRRLGDAPVDPAILESTDAAARTLASLGIAVDEGPLPFDVTPVVEMWPVLGQVGAAYVAGLHPGREHDIGPRMRAQADAGRSIAATRYLDVIEALDAFRRTRDRGVRGRRPDHDAIRRGPAVAGGRAVSVRHRRPGGRPARSCRLHGVGERLRPPGDRAAVGAIARGPADRLPAGRTGRRRRPAAGTSGASSKRRSPGATAGRRWRETLGSEVDARLADAVHARDDARAGGRFDHSAPGARRDDVAGAQRRAPRRVPQPPAQQHARIAERMRPGAVEHHAVVHPHFAAHRRSSRRPPSAGRPLPITRPALTCASASFHSAGASR